MSTVGNRLGRTGQDSRRGDYLPESRRFARLERAGPNRFGPDGDASPRVSTGTFPEPREQSFGWHGQLVDGGVPMTFPTLLR